MTLLIFFILGLIVGSFLNVVIYRLELVESIFWGRSHCPRCKTTLHWYDNVPLVSFILLKGRCRYCGEKISWQYPLVEVLTGIIFTLTAYYFFSPQVWLSWLETAIYLGLFSLLMVIAVYDFKFLKIPMLILWLAIGWVSAGYLLLDSLNFSLMTTLWDSRFLSGLLGAIVASSFFLLLVGASHEKWMGWGDVYLSFLLGLTIGWPNVFWTLMLAFLGGSLVGLILVFSHKKKMNSPMPFGPFLIAALVISIFLLQEFPGINSYFRLIY